MCKCLIKKMKQISIFVFSYVFLLTTHTHTPSSKIAFQITVKLLNNISIYKGHNMLTKTCMRNALFVIRIHCIKGARSGC